MTKTAAAKRFADRYGVYDRSEGKYTLSSEYTVHGINARAEALRGQRDQARETIEKSRAAHESDLRIVMALLGVEDQYEDTVETTEVFYARITANGLAESRDVVTKTAVQKFAEDLRAAQSAIEGKAALKRLRKAIKNVQKESDQ